jgi:hypothetical protein
MPILKKSSAITYLPYEIATNSGLKNNYFQQYAKNYNTLLVEDEPQSVLYIDGNAHESTSLVPFFDKTPNALNALRTDTSTMYEKNTLLTKYSFANASVQTNVTVTNQSEYGASNNVGLLTHGKAADLTNTISTGLLQSVIINGETYTFYLTKEYPIDAGGAYYSYAYQKLVMVQGNSLENPTAVAQYTFPITSGDYSSYTANPTCAFLHIDTTNRYIYFLDFSRQVNSNVLAYMNKLIALKFNVPDLDGDLSFPSAPLRLIANTASDLVPYPTLARVRNNNIISFCGIDAFNNLVFVEQYNRSDTNTYPRPAAAGVAANKYWLRFHIVKYSGGTPTVTRKIDLSSSWDIGATPSPWAPGHAASMVSYPSHFISDATTPTLKRSILVLPQQDSKVAPVVITWDSSLDSSSVINNPFAMDILDPTNITYPGSATSLDYVNLKYDDVVSNANSVYQTMAGFQKAFISTLNSVKYLTFFTSWKYQRNLNVAESIDTDKLNAICYKLTNLDTNPTLEFVQSFPIQALDYFLSDSDTTLNVIDTNGLSFYSLTPNGWVNTSTETGVFTSIALDSFGRLWAAKISNRDYTQWDQPYSIYARPFYDPKLELHIIPRTTAITTSVSFENVNQEYNGVNINNTLLVNAYNSLGQRIETQVLLSIEGPNIVFQAGGTQLTVTTSTIQNTSVPVVITGPGYVNVTASFVI